MEDAGQADGAEERKRHDAPTINRPVDEQPIAARSANAAKRTKASSGPDHDAIMRRLTGALVVWTAALVLVGVVAAAIAYNQFRIMRDQLAEMRGTTAQTERAITQAKRLADQGARQLTQATRLADAAQRQASGVDASVRTGAQQLATTRDAEQRQLRAYVNIIDGRVENFSAGARPVFFLTVRNSGGTPAYVYRHTGITYAATTPGQYRPITIPSRSSEPSTLAAGASSQIIAHLDLPVTAPQVEAIKKGAAEYVMQGSITYRDGFGLQHLTKYRFLLSGDEPLARGLLLPAAVGNDAN